MADDEDPPPPPDDQSGGESPEVAEEATQDFPAVRSTLDFDAPFEIKEAARSALVEATRIFDAPDKPLRSDEPPPRERTEVSAVRARVPAPSVSGARGAVRSDAVGARDAGARHNWIPTGPRNVGGRITALAVHPTGASTIYAGAASGGVFRTTDYGESWSVLPFWNDAPSLAIGAIGICRDHPETIYVATGEIQTGGGEIINGNGIYVSNDAGDTWSNPLAPPAAGEPPVPGDVPAAGAIDRRGFRFDGIAVHPTNAQQCWAVGPHGVYRTTDGGQHWHHFDVGRYYSDVAFSQRGTPPRPILYLVRCGRDDEQSFRHEASVVRLDNPDADDPTTEAALANAANRTVVIAAPGAPPAPEAGKLTKPPDAPARGKIAISRQNPAVAYVRFATHEGKNAGIFRSRNARNNPVSGVTWAKLPDHADWESEGQGTYNLTIAVSPANTNHIATGMVDLYVSRNANDTLAQVRFIRAMAWDLYHLDRGHHADHHATVFAAQPNAPNAPPALWAANDGGIARSTDWSTGRGYPTAVVPRAVNVPAPPPPPAFEFDKAPLDDQRIALPLPSGLITWRKRSHGIGATQLYDITQSPLLPTMFGGGFQDNGVFVTAGGDSWKLAVGADGGLIAFDPDDPYRFYSTWYGGIAEVRFPGALDGTLPLAGDPVTTDLWPRVLRLGFDGNDDPTWTPAIAHHPRKRHRLLVARNNRLYGTTPTRGEAFFPEPAGRSFELSYSFAIRVIPSTAALPLGLYPHTTTPVRSFSAGPYALNAGDVLSLFVDARHDIVFNPGHEIADLAHAQPAEVAAYLRRELSGVVDFDARTCFWPQPSTVELTALDNNTPIALDGTALADVGTGLSRLGVNAGVYPANANRPGCVTLVLRGRTEAELTRNRDFTPPVAGTPLELGIKVGANARRVVKFDAASFSNVASVTPVELAAAIRAAVPAGDRLHVDAFTVEKGVRIFQLTNADNVILRGSATRRLNVPNGARLRNPHTAGFIGLTIGNDGALDRVLDQNVGNFNSYDLTPDAAGDLTLDIGDGATFTGPFTFSAASVRDRRCVTSEELFDVVAAHVAANPVNVSVEQGRSAYIGYPAEIVYSEDEPDVAWVGGSDGTLFKTRTDGRTWETVDSFTIRRGNREVGAIAIKPGAVDTVFVGLLGRQTSAGGDPGFLFRTTNGGRDWVHVGADVKDGGGLLVGVNGLEIDPEAPDTVFAATDAGVFRSTDGGTHWQPFNEGLPNVLIRDIAFVRETRTLRATAWGRGTYERHVGDRPPRDVQLYVRRGLLDDGTDRGESRGPDEYAKTPRAEPTDESPDIKVNRVRPAGIGTDELVDGVEFDEDIAHEDPTPGNAFVFVQVHNRGSFPTQGVRLVALWADTTDGPPPLPANFWTLYPNSPIAGDLGPWNLIGDETIADAAGFGRDRVEASNPRVHTYGIQWPGDLDFSRRIGILVLAESPDDRLQTTEVDLGALLATERKAAYRETPTRHSTDVSRVVIEQTTSALFTLANPAAPPAPPPPTAAAALHLAPAANLSRVLTTAPGPYDLRAPGATPRALTLSAAVPGITVTFRQGETEIRRIAFAFMFSIARVLNREFHRAGFPVRCAPEVIANAAPPPWTYQLVLRSVGSARFSITGGTALAALGLPVVANVNRAVGGTGQLPAAANWDDDYEGFFALANGDTITLTATNLATIRFAQGTDADSIADLQHASADDVRRVLNRGLQLAQLPIRASVPRVDLWVRRSATDAGSSPVAVAGRQSADLVATSPAFVGDRTTLFSLVSRYAPNTLKAGADNFLYLRSANLGNAPQDNGRHRLFELDPTTSPMTRTDIGNAHATVPAGGSAIVEIMWHPPGAAGDRKLVLAVVDDENVRALDPPAFADVAALDAFCGRNPNAAYRVFSLA
jgi:photosystem II stability/assembly factor-like uncharacterized protein